MRAPQQFQWLVRGTKANLKILKGHHGKLCSYSHLTSYIFLKLKDEREGAGLACPSFGNCIELFSLVKTLLAIDKTTHWQGRAPRQEVKRVQHYTAITRSQIERASRQRLKKSRHLPWLPSWNSTPAIEGPPGRIILPRCTYSIPYHQAKEL